MKGCLLVFLVLILLVAIGSLVDPESDRTSPSSTRTQTAQTQSTSEPVVPSSVTFDEVNGLFGASSNLTNLQKDEKWKDYEGLCVEWSGELTYLDEGMLGGLSIGMRHLRGTLTYDVLISAPREQKARLLGWMEGNVYKYKATLKRYGGLLPISADWEC